MRNAFIIIFGALLTICRTADAALLFKNVRLERAARQLGITDSIRPSTGDDCYTIVCDGQPLTVRHGWKGRVEHIGIPLFSPEYESAYPSPVFECLEFLTLCQRYDLQENILALNDIKFLKGDWNILCRMGNQKSVTMEMVKGNCYSVKWTDDGKTIAEIVMPINYELLACMSRKQLVEDFVEKLKDPESVHAVAVNYTQPLSPFYMIPAITHSQSIDSLGNYIFDRSRPGESLANLMLASCQVAPQATLQLELILDKGKREKLQIPLSRWDALCRSLGCHPYYGPEGSESDVVRGVQVMSNVPSGYDHVLYVECAKGDLGRKDISVKATAYLYIPSSNVKELFDTQKQQSKTRRKRKI